MVENFNNFFVSKKVMETPSMCSIYFEPLNGHNELPFSPGQYVILKVVINQKTHFRAYSISNKSNDKFYRITVKKKTDSNGHNSGLVSCWIHDHVKVGDVIQLSQPKGKFLLKSGDNPVVLISAGVGLTPFIPMLHNIASKGRDGLLIHTSPNNKSN